MATKMKYTGARVGADGKEWATQRDSAGREWETDPTTGLPQMTPDTVEIERRKKAAPKKDLRLDAEGFKPYNYKKYTESGMGIYSDTPGPGRTEVVGKNQSRAGAGRGSVNPPVKPSRTTAEKEMLQEVRDAKDRKTISDMGYKKGGSVSRGNGIAQRGKTKGRYI